MPGTWWVAHTRARQEKALAWDLLRAEIDYFLPLVERETFSGGRRRRNLYPLFSNYLFFCGDGYTRHAILETNRVANVIAVHEQEPFVAQITSVERALASQAALELYPGLAQGKRCRVARGPMKGIEGVIVDTSKQMRLVLEVSILGQGASLEIGPDLLEPLE